MVPGQPSVSNINYYPGRDRIYQTDPLGVRDEDEHDLDLTLIILRHRPFQPTPECSTRSVFYIEMSPSWFWKIVGKVGGWA